MISVYVKFYTFIQSAHFNFEYSKSKLRSDLSTEAGLIIILRRGKNIKISNHSLSAA